MARILLVDDDLTFRNLITLILRKESHEIHCADNGKDAAHLFKSDLFDLVITDLVMPEKEGLELIIELRNKGSGTKIIAMTGGGFHRADTYLSCAKAFGVTQTLFKPFTREALLTAIDIALFIDSPVISDCQAF